MTSQLALLKTCCKQVCGLECNSPQVMPAYLRLAHSSILSVVRITGSRMRPPTIS